MTQPDPKAQKRKDQAEAAGFLAAILGLGCLGYWLGGAVLAAAFSLLALAAVCILVGNS